MMNMQQKQSVGWLVGSYTHIYTPNEFIPDNKKHIKSKIYSSIFPGIGCQNIIFKKEVSRPLWWSIELEVVASGISRSEANITRKKTGFIAC